jgi:hypothetical protein
MRDSSTPWKDAGPDIPLLAQARKEYAALKYRRLKRSRHSLRASSPFPLLKTAEEAVD